MSLMAPPMARILIIRYGTTVSCSRGVANVGQDIFAEADACMKVFKPTAAQRSQMRIGAGNCAVRLNWPSLCMMSLTLPIVNILD